MSEEHWYVLHGLNPEPWRVGPASAARNRDGKWFARIGPDSQLVAFQKAVKELLEHASWKIEGDIELRFYFWRKLDEYKTETRDSARHVADATNMQKATEDALQGVLMDNDRAVQRVQATIVEQTTNTSPRIVICIAKWGGLDPQEIPPSVWEDIDNPPTALEVDNSWPPTPKPPVERDCACIGPSHYGDCPLKVLPL